MRTDAVLTKGQSPHLPERLEFYPDYRELRQAFRLGRLPERSIANALAKITKSEIKLMPMAIWNEAVIAESEQSEIVEGNHYFPP